MSIYQKIEDYFGKDFQSMRMELVLEIIYTELLRLKEIEQKYLELTKEKSE